MAEPISIRQLQADHKAWASYNFPNREKYMPLLGIQEEVGELSHSHLKLAQSIRGDSIQHRMKAADAMGDIVIFLLDYATQNGYDLEKCITVAWDEVKERDWIKYPQGGKP